MTGVGALLRDRTESDRPSLCGCCCFGANICVRAPVTCVRPIRRPRWHTPTATRPPSKMRLRMISDKIARRNTRPPRWLSDNGRRCGRLRAVRGAARRGAGAVGSAGGAWAARRSRLAWFPPAAASIRACGSPAHGSPTFFTALRGSLFGAVQSALVDHARLQPLRDHPPGGERAEHGQNVVVGDAVERPGQTCVQNPPPFRAVALDGLVDRLDRVVAATARPEPIGPRLEPGLPLGLQRIDRPSLVCSVGDHCDPQPTDLAAALGNRPLSDRRRPVAAITQLLPQRGQKRHHASSFDIPGAKPVDAG